MRLLLDTNVLYWSVAATGRLSAQVRALLSDPEHEFWTSAVCLAELHIKQAIGKFRIPSGFEEEIGTLGIGTLAFNGGHARWLSRLPLLHRDPFDRMIIAQAAHESMTIVTSDKQFRAYDIGTIINT